MTAPNPSDAANGRIRFQNLHARITGDSWRDQARCAQLSTTVRAVAFWNPPDTIDHGRQVPDWTSAAAICAECPVRRPCRAWAISEGPARSEFAGGIAPRSNLPGRPRKAQT